MSKERLEELAYNVGISLDGDKALMSADDYDFLYNYAKEQAELADYYKHQSKRKTQALEEIMDLLMEDYFENWEQALEIAHKHKRDSVRLDKMESDLRIREREEEK